MKGSEERHELGITWNKYIEWKYKYSRGKKSVERQYDSQSVKLELTWASVTRPTERASLAQGRF